MNQQCPIVRDLMPLVLDNVASAESQKMLDEHLSACAECREYFGNMKTALPETGGRASAQEQTAFDGAARKLRRKKRLRIARNILIGILIGLIVSTSAWWIGGRLTNGFTMLVPKDEYNITLSALSDGRVSVNMDFLGGHMKMAIQTAEERTAQGRMFYVYCDRHMFSKPSDEPKRGYSCAQLSADEMAGLSEIRKGNANDYVTVWKNGDAIPAASAEMEKYFALYDQMKAIVLLESDDGQTIAASSENDQRLQTLNSLAFEAENAVPEWQ